MEDLRDDIVEARGTCTRARDADHLFDPQTFPYLIPTAANPYASSQQQHQQAPRKNSEVAILSKFFDRYLFPSRVLTAYDERYMDVRHSKWRQCYKFKIFPDLRTLQRKICSLAEDQRRFFAVAEPGQPVFFYADCEIEMCNLPPDAKDMDHSRMALDCFFALQFAFERYYWVSLPLWEGTNNRAFFQSRTANEQTASRLSHHMHVPWTFWDVAELKTVTDRYVFPFLWDLGLVQHFLPVRQLWYECPKTGNWKCMVDERVYTPNRNMRMPFCRKAGKHAVLLPWDLPIQGCAAGSRATETDHISDAMILCRNSPTFWNTSTVKGVTKSASRTIGDGDEEEEDEVVESVEFRCLPLSGDIESHRVPWMRVKSFEHGLNELSASGEYTLTDCVRSNLEATLQRLCGFYFGCDHAVEIDECTLDSIAAQFAERGLAAYCMSFVAATFGYYHEPDVSSVKLRSEVLNAQAQWACSMSRFGDVESAARVLAEMVRARITAAIAGSDDLECHLVNNAFVRKCLEQSEHLEPIQWTILCDCIVGLARFYYPTSGRCVEWTTIIESASRIWKRECSMLQPSKDGDLPVALCATFSAFANRA